MYKIWFMHESNVEGVYTIQEEVATELIWAFTKVERLVDKWCEFLIPHINVDVFQSTYQGKVHDVFHIEHIFKELNTNYGQQLRLEKLILKLFLIDKHLDILNDLDKYFLCDQKLSERSIDLRISTL
jgi:hypothetical protein